MSIDYPTIHKPVKPPVERVPNPKAGQITYELKVGGAKCTDYSKLEYPYTYSCAYEQPSDTPVTDIMVYLNHEPVGLTRRHFYIIEITESEYLDEPGCYAILYQWRKDAWHLLDKPVEERVELQLGMFVIAKGSNMARIVTRLLEHSVDVYSYLGGEEVIVLSSIEQWRWPNEKDWHAY